MNYYDPPIDPTDPLGTDLALTPDGDLILTEHGDLQLVSGVDNAKQMIRVRLQTNPDTYIFGDDLGSQLGEMIDVPLNPPNIALIQQYVADALTDPRIVQINSIDVYDPGDGSGSFYVTLNVTLIDGSTTTNTVSIDSSLLSDEDDTALSFAEE
jgi:phage baseplate assembly protein W